MLNGQLTNETLHNLNIIKGEGDYLINDAHQKYIDFSSGLWNVSLGYSHELNQRIGNKFSKILDNNLPYLDMTSYTNDLYLSTAEILLKFIDESDFKNVIYTNSGSESLEVALKIVNTIKKDTMILSFSESYHGTFYGGMSISGLTKNIVQNHSPNYDNKINISMPSNFEEEKEFIKFLKDTSNIGAIFIEPIIGSGGIKFCSFEFYNELLNLCEDKGILTIFDEVATGFYKTGKTFFFKHLNNTPDILCLSKSINNGTLPSGAVIINEKTQQHLSNKKLKHMSTQNGNLLSLASIFETINFYYEYDYKLHNNVDDISNIAKKLLWEYQIDARILGCMIAIPIPSEGLSIILKKLKENGIITYRFINEQEVGLTLFPHINMDIKLFKKSFNQILKVIKKYTR